MPTVELRIQLLIRGRDEELCVRVWGGLGLVLFEMRGDSMGLTCI